MDVLSQAVASDAAYTGAKATWAASQERIPQALAGLLPQLTSSGQYFRTDRTINFRDPAIPASSGTFDTTGVTVSATQPIFRMQNMVEYKQARVRVEGADAQLALAAQELVLRTAQAYFDILFAHDNLALAQAQKSAIVQQLAQAKRSFDAGVVPVTDVHDAQARFDLTAAQEIAALNDIELKNRALEQIIGVSVPPLARLRPGFPVGPPDLTLERLLELASQENLQIQIARKAIDVAMQEIDRNRAAHYPTLDATASYSTNGAGSGIQGGVGNDTRTRTIGVQLAFPIYQGGIVNSRVREAIANEGRARSDLEAARRAAALATRQAHVGLTTGASQIRALESAVGSTEIQLTSTRRGREVGVRTQLDVLNIQQQLFSAQRDLAQARYAYVMSALRLKAAVGDLTRADVAAVNVNLDRAQTAVR